MGIGTKFILNYLLFLQTDKTSVTQEATIFLQKKNLITIGKIKILHIFYINLAVVVSLILNQPFLLYMKEDVTMKNTNQ